MPRRIGKTSSEESEHKEYDQVVIELFRRLYKKGMPRLPFSKTDIERAASDLGLSIRNLPDITYTYRSGRSPLPPEILQLVIGRLMGPEKASACLSR